MSAAKIRERTTAQIHAADPARTVWVSANAGSGKTAVLTDRVARLLLAGARPETILCITFTKAAAAEMANRLNTELAQWARLDDAALRQTLAALDPGASDRLDEARRLFARALDAPGGLRFQTIHSLCEALLQRFPLEAGVAPGFAIIDDEEKHELLLEARDLVVESADAALLAAIGRVFEDTTERDRDGTFGEIARAGRRIARAVVDHGSVEAVCAAIFRLNGVSETDDEQALSRAFLATVDLDLWKRIANWLNAGAKNDVKLAAKIFNWLGDPSGAGLDHCRLRTVLLTDEGEPRKRTVTKGVAAKHPEILDALDSLTTEYLALCQHLTALTVARRSAAALRFGAALHQRYSALKDAHAALDFDDLIARAGGLLNTSGAAAWVLYKLDAGLEHVLVDEAQDTNPEQWAVVTALTGEFFAGDGARERARPRTLFVVGDEKQSIFRFQGAQPEAFGQGRDLFQRLAAERFAAINLEVSFRSAPEVLAAVDAVFAPGQPARAGVVPEGSAMTHRAHRQARGLVELWDLTEGEELDDEADAIRAPVDQLSEASAASILAARVAAKIAGLISSGEARPGDVMILVQRRNALFAALVAALKRAGVPVAGADRMALLDTLVVQDLLAAADFVLNPQDDLTLAALLKSPLCGLVDDDLIDLRTTDRQGRLWSDLRRRAGERAEWAAAVELLQAMIGAGRRRPPFEFYAELLGPRGGRRRLLGRLGFDAADPIDEFLNRTLAYQRRHPPSLQGFTHWLRRSAPEVKRDLEQARDEVRVLTVHAAKGLEAPIVFLPDTVRRESAQNDACLFWARDPDLPLWPGSRGSDSAASAALREGDLAAMREENNRLLYVALTRAKDRLYIGGCAAQTIKDSWYDRIEAALADKLTAVEEHGHRVRRLGAAVAAATNAAAASTPAPALPPWAAVRARPEGPPLRPLAPSRALDEPAASGPLAQPGDHRRRRGLAIHRALQILPDLPEARRAGWLSDWLAHPGHGLDAAAQAEAARQVQAVLADPAFAAVFARGSRAETPLVGLVGERAVSAQVDRLAVTADSVLVVDFKTNRPPARTPETTPRAYLVQMALYRALLQQIFPGRAVQCALLWTDTPHLMPLPDALLDAALGPS